MRLTLLALAFLSATSWGVESPEQCAHNPLQEVKERLMTVAGKLQNCAEALQAGQIKAAGELADVVVKELEAADKLAQRKFRSVPLALKDDVHALSKNLKTAQAASLYPQTRTLSAYVQQFSTTLDCPRSAEPVFVGQLPPTPHVKKRTVEASATYKIYSSSANATPQLVKEFRDVPLGDCATCKRGVSINCFTPKNAPVSDAQKAACEKGLAGGVGLRILSEKGEYVVAVKNGSKYRLSPASAERLTVSAAKPLRMTLSADNKDYYAVEIELK